MVRQSIHGQGQLLLIQRSGHALLFTVARLYADPDSMLASPVTFVDMATGLGLWVITYWIRTRVSSWMFGILAAKFSRLGAWFLSWFSLSTGASTAPVVAAAACSEGQDTR